MDIQNATVKVSKKTGYVTVLYIEAGQMKQVVVTGADIVRNFFTVKELRAAELAPDEKMCADCGHSESRHQTAGGFCKHCPCNKFIDPERSRSE